MDTTRLNHLLQRHLDAELTPEERDELQTLLLSMPEARREYWRQARTHAALRLLGEQTWGQRDALPQRKPVRWQVRHVAWAAGAAVVAMACLVFVWMKQSPMPEMAVMMETQGARWESSTLPTEPGSVLGSGRLRLAEGLARLRFARGADVTLEGPAELEVIGAQVCRLHRGSLVAHVPEQARGFSVLTPSATLIDHGTDFGISTDETGHANVQVMQGEVELRHASGAPPLRLMTREMAAITPEKLLPAMPLEAEPRRPSTPVESEPFTTEITTRTGRGAAAYVSEPRTERNQSSTLLLLKHCAESGYGRKVMLRFDLAALPEAASISQAKLTFSFAPSGYGYASHGDDARIAVYALTEDAADVWNASALSWDSQPAFDRSAGRVDQSKAVRVGEFIVPRGVQTGQFSMSSPQLIERLQADPNRLLTLILVRENRIEQGGGLVLGIAGNQHPALSPPTLRVR
jgi:ferric-dicitrate binding protein FerR (iron transport regulator)